jgi:hypothetical protein
MGPNRHANRMWMFPVRGLQLDGRTTYLNNASYQLRVVFIGCTDLEPLSAQPAHTPHPRHPRRGSANAAEGLRPVGHVFIKLKTKKTPGEPGHTRDHGCALPHLRPRAASTW